MPLEQLRVIDKDRTFRIHMFTIRLGFLVGYVTIMASLLVLGLFMPIMMILCVPTAFLITGEVIKS
jgi:hypothetical protein